MRVVWTQRAFPLEICLPKAAAVLHWIKYDISTPFRRWWAENIPEQATHRGRTDDSKARSGPGTYQSSKSTLRASGAPRFSGSHAPTELDNIILRSQQVPAPGAYHSRSLVEFSRRIPSGSGKFSSSFPKTELDWIQLRSSQVPGPGAHDIKFPEEMSNTAPRFAQSSTPSMIEKAILRAKDTPAPSQYVDAPKAKDWTLRKSQSASFVLRSRAERFECSRKEEGILHPRWHEFPAVPLRPSDSNAPSYSMALRFSPPKDNGVSTLGPGQLVRGADSFGAQILSQKITAPAVSFSNGAKTDASSLPLFSPEAKAVPGPARYNVEEAWKKQMANRAEVPGSTPGSCKGPH